MPQLIESPSTIEAAGTKPKLIEEFVGRVNTGESRLSVARMVSPPAGSSPGSDPSSTSGRSCSTAASTSSTRAGSWTSAPARRSSSAPASGSATRARSPSGATYVAVCLPAFAPDTVHRDDDK